MAMNFASEFILKNEEDVYERVSDDELERGMSVSESDSDEEEAAAAPPPAAAPAPRSMSLFSSLKKKRKGKSQSASSRSKKQSHWKSSTESSEVAGSKKTDREVQQGLNKRWFRRADTNVVSVKFDTLLSPGNMHAGDPEFCSCGAVLSKISQLTTEGERKVWVCEFCGKQKLVDLEDEEIPKAEDVTYLLEPAMSTSSSTMSGTDQSMVIFVVDTSGSMCVTTEVEGKIKMRGTSHLERLQSFNTMNEDQYLPSQRTRNVTYISRLQAMQAAVDHQLAEMATQHGTRRVGLVTFNNEVTVIGDGSGQEVTLAGDKLSNQAQLKKEGSDIVLTKPISESRTVLGDKIYKLEEGGATALGPALVVAVSMAAHHPGSKVILCTDGKANIGLGKLEESEEETQAMTFYGDIGEEALGAGVTVSVITISGTDCKLVHLGQLADKTGGQVNIVDPLKLREEFSNILADPVIATKVKATFILYKDLYIVDELHSDKQECRAVRQVGNAYSSSTITFQFSHRQKAPSSDMTNGDKGKKGKKEKSTPDPEVPEGATASNTPESIEPKDLPFQLQIEYVDTEGNKALRVITRTKPTTSNRDLAEQKANLDILGVHVAKMSSDLALHGQYSRSRGLALMNQRLAWRNCNSEDSTVEKRGKYKSIFGKIKKMENHLSRQQQQERSTTGRTYSDDEDDVDDEEVERMLDRSLWSGAGSRSNRKQLQVQALRTAELDDGAAEMLYELHRAKAVPSQTHSLPTDHGENPRE